MNKFRFYNQLQSYQHDTNFLRLTPVRYTLVLAVFFTALTSIEVNLYKPVKVRFKVINL